MSNPEFAFAAADYYQLDDLLTTEERRLREEVRAVAEARFLPVISQHDRHGTFPHPPLPG